MSDDENAGQLMMIRCVKDVAFDSRQNSRLRTHCAL